MYGLISFVLEPVNKFTECKIFKLYMQPPISIIETMTVTKIKKGIRTLESI